VIALPPELTWTVTGRDAPDPAGWVRTRDGVVAAPCLVGEGTADGALALTSSFEIR
jgi:hypothetical protein